MEREICADLRLNGSAVRPYKNPQPRFNRPGLAVEGTNIHLPVSRVDWAPDGWTDKRQTIEKKTSFSSSPSLNGRNERSSAERDNAAGVNLSISTVNSANPNPVRCQIVFYDRDSAAYERSGGGASALQKDMFTKVKPSHTHFVDWK